MKIKPLAEGLFVTGQIDPDDLAALASKYATIVNNRPDGEEPAQPASAEIGAAARLAGLDYAFVPIIRGQFTDEAVTAFADVVADAARPILAFCRTGSRSTHLWALSEAHKRTAEEILGAAASAGYDLSQLKGRLEATAASH